MLDAIQPIPSHTNAANLAFKPCTASQVSVLHVNRLKWYTHGKVSDGASSLNRSFVNTCSHCASALRTACGCLKEALPIHLHSSGGLGSHSVPNGGH